MGIPMHITVTAAQTIIWKSGLTEPFSPVPSCSKGDWERYVPAKEDLPPDKSLPNEYKVPEWIIQDWDQEFNTQKQTVRCYLVF